MTDHHGKTTTDPAVYVRPPTDAKRRHRTDYCAIAQIAVNRDNVKKNQGTVLRYNSLLVTRDPHMAHLSWSLKQFFARARALNFKVLARNKLCKHIYMEVF